MATLTPDKTGLLKAFLGGLPGPVAARLAMAVEVDRLMDGHVLPHDEILASLRAQLRQAPKQRAPTPLRLFCQPFQDLLTSEPRQAKRKAEIARESLEPVWRWLSQQVIPDQAAAFVGDARHMVLSRRRNAVLARAAQFWTVAADAMKQALSDDAGRKAALKALGSPDIVADAQEMTLLLAAGATIERLQDLLPAPVPALDDRLLWDVRAVYDALAQSQPDVAPYVAVITMNRLARPCEALRLPLQVTRHTDDTLISKTDMGLVGELLCVRMDALKDAIHLTRHPLFDAGVLMDQVRRFTELSTGFTKEIELRREGDWGKRLLADRAAIGQVMNGFMERSSREVAAAMPLLRLPGPPMADFTHAVPLEKHELALRYARLVMGCRNFAAAASFASRQKTACEEISTELQRYVEDVMRELRHNGAHLGVAQLQFGLCVELAAILFSAEEAELLRRRGRAAQIADGNPPLQVSA